jgi:twinkle protein
MLFQHYGSKYIETALDSPIVDDFLVDFENLPLSFLNYYGGTPINEVLEVIDVAIYQHDISHVIIDNLQFMMPRGTTTNGNNIEKYERTTFLDRYESQDVVLDKFRKFATEKNINIIIVIHPRKVDDGTPLTMSSISGTAKATQEADIVLLLQRLNGRTSVEVKKNRFDGELGSVELGWMKDRNAYFEMAPGSQDQNGSPSSSSGGGFRKSPAKIPVNDVDLPL